LYAYGSTTVPQIYSETSTAPAIIAAEPYVRILSLLSLCLVVVI